MATLHEPTIATDELRPTYLEVDLDRLADNYRAIARHVAPARVMPILKANAYGHGLVEVARKLETIGAPYVGVAYLEEGVRLRQHGIRMPVLVMGGIVGSQVPGVLVASHSRDEPKAAHMREPPNRVGPSHGCSMTSKANWMSCALYTVLTSPALSTSRIR